jgi:hypothetical protein
MKMHYAGWPAVILAKLPFGVFRATLLGLAGISLLASVLTWGFFILHTSRADFGAIGIDRVSTVNALTPCARVLESIHPGSPLAIASAHVGDRICFEREMQRGMDLLAGEEVDLQLVHDGQTKHLQLVAVARAPTDRRVVYALINPLVSMVITVVGLLIGLRSARRADLRALGLGLVLLGMVEPTSMPYGAAVAFTFAFLLSMMGPALLFDFALQFPDGAVGPRRRRLFTLRPIVYSCSILVMLVSWANRYTHWSGSVFNTFEGVFFPAMSVLIAIAIVVGRKEAAGDVRARFNWLLPAVLSVGVNVFFTLAPALPAQYDGAATLLAYVLQLIFPLGLGYATLKHRVLDFGFAINRAAVYAIISTILLIAFAFTEFGVDKLLHFHGREANIAIDALVALGVILTFHRLQHWVGHQVDHMFYHQWQEAAQRLDAFIDSAACITREKVLLERFLSALDQFLRPGKSAIYLSNAAGDFTLAQSSLPNAPATIDIDDESVVQLRHQHAIIAISAGAAANIAAFAVPMSVRGQLHGVILLTAKPDGAAFRSDELKSLGRAANSTMSNLEFLRFQQLERANIAMQEEIRQLRRLPPHMNPTVCSPQGAAL